MTHLVPPWNRLFYREAVERPEISSRDLRLPAKYSKIRGKFTRDPRLL
jgi:hypothetical protein